MISRSDGTYNHKMIAQFICLKKERGNAPHAGWDQVFNLKIIGGSLGRCRFIALKPDAWIATARESNPLIVTNKLLDLKQNCTSSFSHSSSIGRSDSHIDMQLNKTL
jgi:hypothetical protein